MRNPFTHRREAGGRLAAVLRLDDLLPRHAAPFSAADRSCCCPARPRVMAVLPATAARPVPADLLLCGHHFHVHEAALRAAGASVYDITGALIGGGPAADISRAVPRPRQAPAEFAAWP